MLCFLLECPVDAAPWAGGVELVIQAFQLRQRRDGAEPWQAKKPPAFTRGAVLRLRGQARSFCGLKQNDTTNDPAWRERLQPSQSESETAGRLLQKMPKEAGVLRSDTSCHDPGRKRSFVNRHQHQGRTKNIVRYLLALE